MPLCCGLYRHCVDVDSSYCCLKEKENKKEERLVGDSVENEDDDMRSKMNKKSFCCEDASLWKQLIVNEVDDFCEDLNSHYPQKYTLTNYTGNYKAPNGQYYPNMVKITSNHSEV